MKKPYADEIEAAHRNRDALRYETEGVRVFSSGASPVIGFDLGDGCRVRTVAERLSLEQLVEAGVGYVALGRLP